MKNVKDVLRDLRGKVTHHRFEERAHRLYAEAYELAAIILEIAIDKDTAADASVGPEVTK